jgi:hypothetical protein
MSQLYDFFACPRPLIERWAEALAAGDEELQNKIEAELPRRLPLNGIGQDELNILAACVAGEPVDVVQAVGRLDLVKAVSEEEGPWVTAFRRPAVKAVAGMRVDDELVGNWVRHVAEFHGESVKKVRRILTTEMAMTFKDLCSLAAKEHLGVFACFYG